MQTSQKVTSVKKAGIFANFFRSLLGSNGIKPIESMGGKGHYFDGNAENGYQYRSSQSKRRKLERRTKG